MKDGLEKSNMIDKMFGYIDIYEVRRKVAEEMNNIAKVANSDEFKMLLDIILKYPDTEEVIKENWKEIYSSATANVELISIFAKNPNLKRELDSNMSFLFERGKWGENGSDILARELSKLEGGEENILRLYY